MNRVLCGLGSACARHPWLTIATWLLLAIVVTGAVTGTAPGYASRTGLSGTESQETSNFLHDHFNAPAADATISVLAKDGDLRQGVPRTALDRIVDRIRRVPHVAEGSVNQPRVSDDGKAALLSVAFEPGSKPSGKDLERLRSAANSANDQGLRSFVSGGLAQDSATSDIGTAEQAGFAVVVVVLLIAFGTVVAAAIPLITAVLGMLVGLGLVRLVALGYAIDASAPSLATMVGLGVAVDYALFIVTRYREELRAGQEPHPAAVIATATAGSSVFYAGVTVIVAILGLAAAGIPLVTSLGVATAVVVAIAMAAALTLLPALLGLVGRRIDRLRLPFLRRPPPLDPDQVEAPVDRWRRWARHVENRPWPYAIAFGLLMIALATPTAKLRLGESDGGAFPGGTDIHRGYQVVADHFGIGMNGPLRVAVDATADRRLSPDELRRDVTDPIGDVPGVASVSPPRISEDGTAGVITVVPDSAPRSADAADLVKRLRSTALPAAADRSDTRLLLGGEPAGSVDFTDRVADRLPIFVGAVLVLSFIMLMFVFRSLLVPLKAVFLNMVSIAVSYGLLVACLQWGWFTGLFGLSGAGPVIQIVPMMMFAIVFGLSMDYEVFLLSRMKEEWMATGDNSGSVIEGVATTARVISAAAAIMVCVFAAFILNVSVVVKMMGFGLAVAVLLDATVIRLVLVPALMALFGEANWWLPRWLDRWLPHIHLPPLP